MRSTYWLDAASTAKLKVSGLKQYERYDMVFFASRKDNNQKTNRTTDYTVSGTSVSLNATDNTSKVVKISEIVPNAPGEAIIDIAPNANSLFEYIGALIINGYSAPGNNARIENSELIAKVKLENELTTHEEEIINEGRMNVYPNPFGRELSIGLDEHYKGQVYLTLRNVLGRVVRHELIYLNENQNDIVLQDLNLTNGIYILSVSNSSGQTSNFRITKE